MDKVKRYYIIFRGRVQGVGFRWTCQTIAQKLGLSGWVRNLDNGDVDCEVQGTLTQVKRFLQEILKSQRWIRIDDYTCKEIPTKNDDGRFRPRN